MLLRHAEGEVRVCLLRHGRDILSPQLPPLQRKVLITKSVKSLVIHQAKLAKKAALDALVCSPYEVSSVRKIFKKEIITPGVQIGKRNYDQKRSMEAKRVRSDWLVIGRAITRGDIKKNIQNLTKELR